MKQRQSVGVSQGEYSDATISTYIKNTQRSKEVHVAGTGLPHHLLCIFEELFGGIAAVVIQEAIFPSNVIRRQVMKQIAETFALIFHVRAKRKLIVFV